MAKEYRRKPDTSVELVSVHQEFTDPEFEDHKGLVGQEISALSDEISALKHAEIPPDATVEQQEAIHAFNINVDFEMDRLKQRRKDLLAELVIMEGV